MIIGTVDTNREPVVRLDLSGPQGEQRDIETIIDTGFNGFLALPHAVITALGLRRLGRGRALLANGSEAIFDIYETTVTWDGKSRAVEVDATENVALLGMSMLYGHELWVHAVEGGRVTIQVSG